MKLRRKSNRGFTLTELMIASSLLLVVLGGILSTHLFGMRMNQLTKAKLGANDDSRKAIAKLSDEVKGAKWVRVGTGTSNSFVEVEDGELQRGNSLQVYTTPSANVWVRYYTDASSKELRRVTSLNPAPSRIAQSLSNVVVFASETGLGAISTNNDNNRVISMNLQFYQIQYPIVRIGPGEYYDFYQLRAKFTRRALE